MSENAANVVQEEHRAEPGLGLALLTVLVMLLVTSVLAGLIYILMVAISPIEQRTPKAAAGVPATEQAAPATPLATPAAPVPAK